MIGKGVHGVEPNRRYRGDEDQAPKERESSKRVKESDVMAPEKGGKALGNGFESEGALCNGFGEESIGALCNGFGEESITAL